MDLITAGVGDILLDDNGVKISIIAVKGEQVSLKIEVPEGVDIIRDEVLSHLDKGLD